MCECYLYSLLCYLYTFIITMAIFVLLLLFNYYYYDKIYIISHYSNTTPIYFKSSVLIPITLFPIILLPIILFPITLLQLPTFYALYHYWYASTFLS